MYTSCDVGWGRAAWFRAESRNARRPAPVTFEVQAHCVETLFAQHSTHLAENSSREPAGICPRGVLLAMSLGSICHAGSGHLVRQMRRPSPAAARVLMLAMPFLLILGSGSACYVGFIGRCTEVMGCYPHHGERSQIVLQVRERRKSRKRFPNPSSQGAPDPMVLTSKIKSTESMAELKALLEKELETHGFNEFHMSATFTQLTFFDKQQRLSASDAKKPTSDQTRNQALHHDPEGHDYSTGGCECFLGSC